MTEEEKGRKDLSPRVCPGYSIATDHLLGTGSLRGFLTLRTHSLQSGCWSRAVRVQIQALPLSSWVSWGSILHLPELQFPRVSNGYNHGTQRAGCCKEARTNELVGSLGQGMAVRMMEAVLQTGKLRLSDVRLLLKVTGLLRGRTGI